MKIAWMLLCTIAGVTVRPAREVIDVDLIEHDVEREDVMRYPKVERPSLFATTASAAVATISETP